METKKPIDLIQIKLIKIAQRKLGLSDENYRTILNDRYWVNSCKALSYDEATDLIKHFQSLGFKIVTKRYGRRAKSKEHRAPNIIQLVSKEQLSMINHLKEDIRWHVHDGFYRWLRKYLKREEERGWTYLIKTSREANAVIEALKGMKQRQKNAKRIEQSEIENQDAMRNAPGALQRDGGMHGGYYKW